MFKSEGSSPISAEQLASQLTRETTQRVEPAFGQPDWDHRIALGLTERYLSELAAFDVLQTSLDAPPHLRTLEFAEQINHRVRDARREVSVAFRSLRRLTGEKQ